MKTYNNLRASFKEYFGVNGHSILPSSNLVPKDASLLFTNSGMVQFKDIFTGSEKTNFRKAVTVQKCIRAGGKHNDLENVGFTNRHHTFFEMLGNFSFNDYFKEEAIFFAWQFLTKELGLAKEKLYITVYHEDEEAFKIWQNLTGFSEDKIIKIKTNDNFWSMGNSGPCGPCSEIFYDYGEKIQGGLPGTAEQDGARYTEIWNLVFMQFNQVDENTRVPLLQKGIDTGMGLERLASVIEGKVDNYQTSLFQDIIHFSKGVIGRRAEDDIVYRIVADHARSISFLIADGVLPSNEGRGYVLRRIMRRALKHLYMIGYRGGDLHKITSRVVSLMKGEYPELAERETLITNYVNQEEEKFLATLPSGMKFIENEINSNSEVTPAKAFMLYDTFGFPLDITNDVLKSKNKKEIPEEDFEKEMKLQRERSKASWKGSGDVTLSAEIIEFASQFKPTVFMGYTNLSLQASLLGTMGDYAVFESTVFYPEGGGQMADAGSVNGIPVLDVIKVKEVILHKLASTGGLKVGEKAELEVDVIKRKAAANAHSATHLLHHFLRERFGETVIQKGSFVGRDYLRFDFSFNRPITDAEIWEIEDKINAEIVKDEPVKVELKSIEEAKKSGAIAFFGEKYGSEVRMLTIGKSIELCGGTHALSTGQICGFKIVSEGAVSSGVRRIEAIVGEKALKYMMYAGNNLESIRGIFKLGKSFEGFMEANISADKSLEEITKLQDRLLRQKKEIDSLTLKLALQEKGVREGNFYIKCVTDVPTEITKDIINHIKQEASCIVLFSFYESKGTLHVHSSSKDINANEIGKQISAKIGGKGGGSAGFASFGGITENISLETLKSLIAL